MSGFRDHFSGHAGSYAEFRPRYPAALFDFLAAVSPSRRRAWDCATGNGQAALDLAARFEAVVATDASARQLEEAFPHERVTYRVAPAERSGLPDASFDLVTVAQALHWFDVEAFWVEVRRVLVPGGVVAAWCYSMLETEPAIDAILDRFYHDTVGPWWPPERHLVEEGYRSLPLPFEPIGAPAFAITLALDLEGLLGYVRTWSAVRRYAAEHGSDPVDALREEIAPSWGDPARRRAVRWPIHLRVGRCG